MSDLSTLQQALQEAADALKKDWGGTLGIAATFLPTGESIEHNADVVFPTASVIKIAIVSEMYTQVAEGKLSPEHFVTLTRDEYVAGSGVLALLSPGFTLTLADLAMLTISVSDNTASNACLKAVGGPDVVNRRMRETWGLTDTTIHRPIKFGLESGDPPHTATGTPRDMLGLVQLLHAGKVHSREASDNVLKTMAEVRDNDLLPRYLTVNPYAKDLRAPAPPFRIQHKTGAINGTRNDAALITRGEETLAVCVYTKEVRDETWTAANQASETVAQVGRLLCDHFFA